LNVEELLSLKIKPLSDIKYVVALIGLIAFLVFFAVSPLHALILCGLLVMFGSMYFKVEKENRKMAFIAGLLLMVIGVLGILVPTIKLQILSVAENLRELMTGA